MGEDKSNEKERAPKSSSHKRIFLQKGETLFGQNDLGTESYIVINGKIELSYYQDGEKKIFDTVRKNGIFGEMALFDLKRRLVTATALTDTECAVIDERFMHIQLSKTHPILKTMLKMMTATIKNQINNDNQNIA